MLSVVEDLLVVEEVVLVWVTVGFYISEEFQLIQCLIEEVLIVLDHLETCKILII